jgi:hypothetical protein
MCRTVIVQLVCMPNHYCTFFCIYQTLNICPRYPLAYPKKLTDCCYVRIARTCSEKIYFRQNSQCNKTKAYCTNFHICQRLKAVCPKKKAKVANSDVASSAQETGTASSIQERQSSPSSPSVTSHHRVIISDKEDEDSSSHCGQTLDRDSDVIMVSKDKAVKITGEKELGMREPI